MEIWDMNDRKEKYKIDYRTRQDVIDQVERLALSYTPEWKFDTKNPDATSVIGIIFSNQTLENIKKLNQVFNKYHIEFANMYGVSLRPAIPAKAVCTLQIGEGIKSGVDLKKGTQVMGVTEEGDDQIFAFKHDIHAVNAKLTDILEVSAKEKKIIAHKGEFAKINYCNMKPYHIFTEEDYNISFKLFAMDGENIHKQALVLYFSSFPDIKEQRLRLRFSGNLLNSQLAKLFADETNFKISYISDSELYEFDIVESVDDFIEIENNMALPQINYNDKMVTAIVLEMNKFIDENIFLNNIELFVKKQEMKPDFIWNGKNEVLDDVFAPFTQQPSLYQEFYIGHRFLFEQKGTIISLNFQLEFAKFLPESTSIYEPDLRIIKRKPKRDYNSAHYECHIQEVTFEYFNGKGWKRLNTSIDTRALFSKEDNAGKYNISFEVPSDWESVIQGGFEGKCIRMQIVRADNCYMQNVEYVYPIVSSLNICMTEQSKGIMPEKLFKIQGTIIEDVTNKLISNENICSFSQLPYVGDFVYFGFNKTLKGGPVTLFIELEHTMNFKDLELVYEYSTRNGFRTLKLVDYTDSFQNSGIIMFIAPTDMAEYEVEGVSRCWIRIEDKKRCFAENREYSPIIKNIYMNAVMVENIEQKEEQDYYIDTITANMKFSLNATNILEVQVWVNEKEQLTVEEMNAYINDSSIETKVEYNFLGEIEEFYILWHEVEGFENADYMERCYCIDRGKNELIFGDGVHVKIPRSTNSIAFKTKVSCCNGESANIKANTIDRFVGSAVAVEGVINPIDAYGGTNLEDIQDALKRGSNILSSRKRLVTEKDYINETLAFSDLIEQVSCVVGIKQNGEYDDSVISIILLMKDYKRGNYSFKSIQDPLRTYLMKNCEVTFGISDIQIIEPVFVNISLDIWLDIPDISDSLEIKQKWLETIEDFFEPVKYKTNNGWCIGKLPNTKQIRLMLSTLENSANIVYMNVLAEYTYNQNCYKVSIDNVEENLFMVCCNGTHNIYINGVS